MRLSLASDIIVSDMELTRENNIVQSGNRQNSSSYSLQLLAARKYKDVYTKSVEVSEDQKRLKCKQTLQKSFGHWN